MKFEVTKDGRASNYTRVPLNIEMKVNSGSIKSVYLAMTDKNNNLMYRKMKIEKIRKELFQLNAPKAVIKYDVETHSVDKVQYIPLWLIIVDNDNNTYLDFYEIITDSFLKVENQAIRVETNYKTKDILYNYRSIKYESLFESDFLKRTKWSSENSFEASTYSEEKILSDVHEIKNHFNINDN